MAAARKRSFNCRSKGSARSGAIAAIQICWKQMRPDLDKDESRDERLAWIGTYLGIRDLDSITDLSDAQLGSVAGEMKRLTGVSSQQSAVSSQQKSKPVSGNVGNVVTGEFGRESKIQNPKSEIESETVFLASPEQAYTLDKLQSYLGWTPSDVFEFIRKRVIRGKARFSGSVPNFKLLTFRQATSATNMLLHIAAHRDLKIRSKGQPVSRAEINKYIPILKRELRIDQQR